MFFWLIAIPFFVIVAMFTLFRLPSSGLHEPEDIQDTAMAFRMVLQHDAAAKMMQEYQASNESNMFDEGSYDLGGDTWEETILNSGYLPANFIPDTDNITTYIRCLDSSRQVVSCHNATGVYMVTAATPPSGDSITARWFEQKGAVDLATQLKKYEGSFPVKLGGLVLPKKPRKEEGESDQEFNARLDAYNEIKARYKLLKRNYYSFGSKLPRPKTVVGQVRAFPFNSDSAESRVILRRIKEIAGEIVFDKDDVPTDLPSGGEGSEAMDFNGEAIIFTASLKQSSACVVNSDCDPGYVCNAGVCEPATTCTTSNDCVLGYYCNEGTCTQASFTCGTTDYIENETWIRQWSACSRCPEGQFKKYQSEGENGENSDYPVAHNAGCVNIPALNGYTVMPTGSYYVDISGIVYSTVSNANLWHRRVNITCNGNNEEWDVVGPFPNWWEAQEICAKLGKTLPVDHTVLIASCDEGFRTHLIKEAMAVGTGQTLEEVNVMSGPVGWDSITGNNTGSGDHYVFMNRDVAGLIGSIFGIASDDRISGYPRSYSGFDTYVLCGPAICSEHSSINPCP